MLHCTSLQYRLSTLDNSCFQLLPSKFSFFSARSRSKFVHIQVLYCWLRITISLHLSSLCCDIRCLITISLHLSSLCCDIRCLITTSLHLSSLCCDIRCLITISLHLSSLCCDIRCFCSQFVIPLRARSHMHWGSALAARFCGSETGASPAEPRVYGHT